MFNTLILGTKKISVIACGQTSSMALSDAGEVRVKKDETVYWSIYNNQVNTLKNMYTS